MDSRRALTVLMAVAAVVAAAIPSTAGAKKPAKSPVVSDLATFSAPGCAAACGSGSTIGPDKALYVTDGPGGRVLRVDPKTGAVTTFASGLPVATPGLPFGGAEDVAFFGQANVVDGLYRIAKNGTPTAIADIGAWSIAHPPAGFPFVVTTGVQYALQKFRGAFLVTDGHHNRVLRVTRTGGISQMIAFGDIVPTGLEVHGKRIYMAEAGPVPHVPQTGKVVRFTPKSTTATDVASGAPLLVDVEFGRGRQLYALSQGIWDLPNDPANAGLPASANTGKLVRVKKDGTFASVAEGLDRPTSVDFIGNTAFVITLTGKVIKITNVGGPPFGKSH
jgi:sugar lactone lactonase YvrE